jgi:hypothetical protein
MFVSRAMSCVNLRSDFNLMHLDMFLLLMSVVGNFKIRDAVPVRKFCSENSSDANNFIFSMVILNSNERLLCWTVLSVHFEEFYLFLSPV